jgi:tRNA threonylcarbamoyladenosine biosynthesis protein TsaE
MDRPFHDVILRTRHSLWLNEAACAADAAKLAARVDRAGALITLHGTLGAGKTTFTRALLRALGVQGRIKSPTYALVETYSSAQCHIAHMDLYRLQHPNEFESAGLRDALGADQLTLVEWPERAGASFPRADLAVYITVLDEAHDASALTSSAHRPALPDDDAEGLAWPRDVLWQARSPRGMALLEALA